MKKLELIELILFKCGSKHRKSKIPVFTKKELLLINASLDMKDEKKQKSKDNKSV